MMTSYGLALVKRVVIYADTPEQQASAHRLLAAVSLQMVQLDQGGHPRSFTAY